MKTIREVIELLQQIEHEVGAGTVVKIAHPDSGVPQDVESVSIEYHGDAVKHPAAAILS